MTVWPAHKFADLFLLGSQPHGTKEPSFDIEIGQVRFLVLIFDHSVTTYSAPAETHVNNTLERKSLCYVPVVNIREAAGEYWCQYHGHQRQAGREDMALSQTQA